ncbi:hypothetical protein [Planctomyces sp. SH-PL14]|uniref:hypothetical protein n=1 Tax=Planctomyces sp. SH-PL14 TaxID=1632864 RepID=UPI0012E8C255|nr:hypothetical protein [Planctomyces sp. SH-PL14]
MADNSQPKAERLRLAMGWHRQGFDCVEVIAFLSTGKEVDVEAIPIASKPTRLSRPGQFRPSYGVGRRVKEAIGLTTTCPLCNATLEEMNNLGPLSLRDPGPLHEYGRRMRKNAEALARNTEHANWLQRQAISIGLALKGVAGSEESARRMILEACDAEDAYLAKPVTWFVGIRTAPRQEPTLQRCVASIVAAGWTPTIFAEPGTDLSGLEELPIVQRPQRLGVWHNWYDLLKGALTGTAEQILTFEDDAIMVPGAREFVERSGVLAEPRLGFASLYTSKVYHQETAGWHRVEAERLFWGSVALAMPRSSVEKFVKHRIAMGWKGIKGNQVAPDIWGGDVCVARVCHDLGLSKWVHSPSLCQHVGDTSTIPGHVRAIGNRRAKALAVLTGPEE